MFELKIRAVGLDSVNRTPVLILQETTGSRILPLGIGRAEVRAIVLVIQGTPPPRPISYDLVGNILEKTGINMELVVIVDLQEGVFYAEIDLRHGEKLLTMDSRPSDAIALSMRIETPVYVTENVAQQVMVEEEVLGAEGEDRMDEEER